MFEILTWHVAHAYRNFEYFDNLNQEWLLDCKTPFCDPMHSEIEKEVVDFYQGPYRRSILGDKGFVEWVKERLGDRPGWRRKSPSLAGYLD